MTFFILARLWVLINFDKPRMFYKYSIDARVAIVESLFGFRVPYKDHAGLDTSRLG